MILDKKRLLAALTIAARFAKQGIHFLNPGCVYIAPDGSLTCTDMGVAVTVQTAAPHPAPACIPVKGLLAAVRAAPDGPIQITDASLITRAGVTAFKVLPPKDFPVVSGAPLADPAAIWTVSAATLAATLRRVSRSMNTEQTRYYLNGIALYGQDGGLTAVATDGHRMTAAACPGLPGCAALRGSIVPARTVKLLLGMFGAKPCGDATVTVNSTRIEVVWGGARVVSKLIDGIFPDWERCVPSGRDAKGILTVDAATLAAACKQVRAGSPDRSAPVKFDMSDAGLIVSYRDVEYGNAFAAVPGAIYAGEPIETAFQELYIADMLAGVAGDATWRFSHATHPARIELPGGVAGVLMPIRC
jgi:DNA polymerase-3 subunit beta